MLSNLHSRAGELKSQGAAEAARDPNSSVSAHDAEQTMHEESRKAGSSAFQFNADATPEEKAAQARSVGATSFLPLKVYAKFAYSSKYLQGSTVTRSPKPQKLLQI